MTITEFIDSDNSVLEITESTYNNLLSKATGNKLTVASTGEVLFLNIGTKPQSIGRYFLSRPTIAEATPAEIELFA